MLNKSPSIHAFEVKFITSNDSKTINDTKIWVELTLTQE